MRTFGGIAILRPLAIRDFALLWTGMTVSFVGDGIFFVAIAWQVYDLSNVPTALSVVFLAMTLPQVVFLLVGGVLADRFERRRLMITAVVLRGAAVAVLGGLSVTGMLDVWHVLVVVAVYGAGEALFAPAFGAIVPDLVPRELLLAANSLHQLVRPLALRLAGPALGGWLVSAFGAGQAFLVDAGSFAVSALALVLMRARPIVRDAMELERSVLRDVREGFRFVRSHTWLWGTLVSAAFALLVFYGPWEVLVPFVVRNELGGTAGDLGLVFAAGGAGAIVASVVMGQLPLPRRQVTFMYGAWTIGVLGPVVYGLATELWHMMAAALVSSAASTAGMVVWLTLVQRHVPTALLGRVTSFDWFVSISLIPVSFAMTGPIGEAAGARETLVGAGILAAVVTVAFLFLPGMRDIERAVDDDKSR